MNANNNNGQDIIQYFNALQREYYEAEIREKIYPFDKHKKHYQELMDKKREKIEDIALRNNLKSIFNDKSTRIVMIKQVYPEVGLPKFKRFHKFDLINLYEVGRKVKVHRDGKPMNYDVGTIISVDMDARKIKIDVNGSEETHPMTIVTRVL